MANNPETARTPEIVANDPKASSLPAATVAKAPAVAPPAPDPEPVQVPPAEAFGEAKPRVVTVNSKGRVRVGSPVVLSHEPSGEVCKAIRHSDGQGQCIICAHCKIKVRPQHMAQPCPARA